MCVCRGDTPTPPTNGHGDEDEHRQSQAIATLKILARCATASVVPRVPLGLSAGWPFL